MANYGRPHSNNSQFFITSVSSPHLDGSNVVFGRILKGFSIIAEMEKFGDDDAVPSTVSIAIPMNIINVRFIYFLLFFASSKYALPTAER